MRRFPPGDVNRGAERGHLGGVGPAEVVQGPRCDRVPELFVEGILGLAPSIEMRVSVCP